MSDIDEMAVRRLDMTLLMVFAETIRHRKLTQVAARLGLTQSAISHSLARLRDVFGDPLFLRRPHGLEPTTRALALEPRIAAILTLAREALQAAPVFDPATAKRRFRIAALDHMASLFGPPLYRLFERSAPGIELAIRSAARSDALERLRNGELDLILGFLAGTSGVFETHELYEETYAVAARRGHPHFDGSLARFLAADHALVSLAGDARGVVDEALAETGKERRVAAVFPLFFPALATVAETDLIVTLPRRLAEANAARFALALYEPPLILRPFTVNAVTHKRDETDGGLLWLIARLREIARGE